MSHTIAIFVQAEELLAGGRYDLVSGLGAEMPEYAELWLILRLLKHNRRRFSASLHQPAATSGPETVREIDMRRMSKLPNTETDIFEWSSHAWSWRVFGRSEMVSWSCRHQHVHGNGGLAEMMVFFVEPRFFNGSMCGPPHMTPSMWTFIHT